MDENNETSSAPPTQPVSPASSTKSGGGKSLALIILAALVGLGGGYLLGSTLSSSDNENTTANNQTVTTVKEEELTVPSDAVQVQACANNKGTLFAKAADIPLGPIYMVHNNKVIGIEFMLDKDEFLADKSFKFLTGKNVKVDHANIGSLSKGHEGFTKPHYHVDLYSVSKEVEQAITCPVAP